MKQHPTSLITGEIQTSSTVKYRFTPTRKAIKKKKKRHTENNKCWKECGGTGTLVLCWWECTCAAAVENNTVPQNVSSELPIDSAIPLLELKAETQTDMCTPMLTAALLTITERR